MAHFGANSATVSIILSVFMLGLAAGSLTLGRIVAVRRQDSWRSPLVLYAVCELMIGIGAVTVPVMLTFGRNLLLHRNAAWGSPGFTVASGVLIAAALLPWTFCMGGTFPLAMAVMRDRLPPSGRNFSFLYTANVVGATLGTIIPAFLLIEIIGFADTLWVAFSLNLLIALVAIGCFLRRATGDGRENQPLGKAISIVGEEADRSRWPLALLFLMGLSSLVIEVLWIRLYTPFLNSYVYTFAGILGIYLASNYLGSLAYRIASSRFFSFPLHVTWPLFSLACAGSYLFVDPRIHFGSDMFRLVGIVPACVLMGMITPQLVDRCSGGEPRRAGFCYFLNTVGCILGPLLGGFVMIPWMGERWAGLALALVLVAAAIPILHAQFRVATVVAVMPIIVLILLFARTRYDIFELEHPEARTVRDHAATTVALGEGMKKKLYVNGCSMTALSDICKTMAHLPMAMAREKPRKVLVLCFGMGTAFRSAETWGADVTAVELVPGVYDVFNYFHADADRLARLPNCHLVVDDGRRFLERTQDRFDLIMVDPSPPVESVGTSLLHSRQFFEIVRQHLTPNGILCHRIPTNENDPAIEAAIAKSISSVFPHVQVYSSYGKYGHQLLASLQPLEQPELRSLIARMPARAAADAGEWSGHNPAAIFETTIPYPGSIRELIATAPKVPALDDDHPINEYFLLRKHGFLHWD